MSTRFVLLSILDGWGIAVAGPGNAISQSSTPNLNRYWSSFPHTQLQASGNAVGLPKAEPGNTETGHLNLGAGRIVYQDLERINMSIADGTFFSNQQLLGAIEHAKKNSSNLHIMGLIGAGGVHSNMEHLFALIQLTSRNKFNNVFLHLFTDGRDSPPMSAKIYVDKIQKVVEAEDKGVISTIMGRYWAMDRDFRWERTKLAYDALTKGLGRKVKTPQEAIELSYKRGETDEFIEPSIVVGENGDPVGLIKDNDSIIFFNFRIDRPRQLSRAFMMPDFSEVETLQWDYDPYSVKYTKKHSEQKINVPAPFDRGPVLKNIYFVTMTEYDKYLGQYGVHIAYPPALVDMPLGGVIAASDLRQLRVAESEKERFVTTYFNGLQEFAFPGEDRVIIPSPKVPTYDQRPEMAAKETTEMLLTRLKDGNYSFILINYANPDMVAHTGNIGATATACSVVDECLGKLANFCLAYDGVLIITADHGNAEEMINPHTGAIDTEHNANPVPFVAVAKEYMNKAVTLSSGILADVAPTILNLLGLSVPSTMTGKNLLRM